MESMLNVRSAPFESLLQVLRTKERALAPLPLELIRQLNNPE